MSAEPIETAPLRLAAELERRPSGMQEICPPFVLTCLDRDRNALRIWTDSVGIGRLFEARTPWGWVWSNRPEATLAFAGLPYCLDEATWAQMVAADEMFGHGTPYQGVRQIDAATCITWDGRSHRLQAVSHDPVTSWSAPGPAEQHEDLLDSAADALAGVARSIGNLFPEVPVVALSGGRDSRLVASAFVAAGTEIRLTTHDGRPEDLQVAKELVTLLEDPPEHMINHVATGNVAAPEPWEAYAKACAWHEYAEGLRPYSFLHGRPPQYIDFRPSVIVGGVGGEVAHGFFYPADRQALEALPQLQMISRFTEEVVRRYVPVEGPQPQALDLIREHIRTHLSDIAAHGYDDSTMLDIFYVRQRMRRWGTTAERPDVVSPLVSPNFIRACIGLTPEQRKANVLHRELTRRLVPQWSDVPYYPSDYANAATRRRAVAPRIIRIADAEDRDLVNSLVHHEETWRDVFMPDVVHQTWADSTAGLTDARHERILRAVVWRAAFMDRLDTLNFVPERPRSRVPWVAPPPAAPQPEPAVEVSSESTPPGPLSRLARRAAHTTSWEIARDTQAGHAIRSVARAARRAGVRL